MWLIEPNAFQQFLSLASVEFDTEQAKAAAQVTPRRTKNVAVLPVHGALEARPSFIGEMLGMSSYERIGNGIDMLMADESVSGIILDVASPGGMVYGAMELADKIFRARSIKPIVAVANPMAASGAYWLAAAASHAVVTPSGDVGSVGVIAEHVDLTKAMERGGAKVTTIRSTKSPYKGEGGPAEPLTEETLSHLQSRADAIYGLFVADLARFRGVSVDHVNEHFGKGRIVSSKAALSAGMVDRVGSLQEVAYRMMEGRIRINREKAEFQWDAPTISEQRRMRAAEIRAMAETTVETV